MDDARVISDTRRWVILGSSLLAALTTTCVVSGIAYLIPSLHTDAGLTLTEASTLAAIPTIGLTTATILWGRRVQSVDATPGCCTECSCSPKTSAGV
ncbi:hypothetical protein R4227_06710, partial [Gordonia amicalis]|nr:hypothetical protein [Gordonia amicalis]